MWVISLAIVAFSSFWIHELRVIGLFSPIHIQSLITLWTLPCAVRDALMHRVAAHKRQMKVLAFGALGVAGAFTLFPGRIMCQVISGG